MEVERTVHARRDWLVFAGLLAGALLVFAPVLGAYFVSDDFFLIKAAHERPPFGMLTFGEQFFRPAAALSFWIDAHLFGLRPLGFHTMNVALHALACFALFKIGEQLALSRAAALAAAALFLVAPAHSEPVAWISCRMDLLATAAGLCGLYAWLGALRAQRGSRVVGLLLLSVGLLAKESASSLCAVFALVALAQKSRRRLWDAVIPLVVFATYLVVRRACLGRWVGGYATSDPPSLLRYASHAAMFSIRGLAGPFPGEWINLDRPLYGVVTDSFAGARARPGLTAALVLALLGVIAWSIAWIARRRQHLASPVALLAVAYVLTLLPVLHLDVSTVTVEGERFLYLPSAFLLLLLTTVAARVIVARARIGVTIATSALCLLALEHSLTAWRDAGRLAATLLPEIADAAATRPLVLANLPDDIRGAYVFRNGLQEALALFHPGAQPVSVAVLHSVLAPSEGTRITCDGASLTLRMGDPRSFILGAAAPTGLALVGDPIGANVVELRGLMPPRLWSYAAESISPVVCSR